MKLLVLAAGIFGAIAQGCENDKLVTCSQLSNPTVKNACLNAIAAELTTPECKDALDTLRNGGNLNGGIGEIIGEGPSSGPSGVGPSAPSRKPFDGIISNEKGKKGKGESLKEKASKRSKQMTRVRKAYAAASKVCKKEAKECTVKELKTKNIGARVKCMKKNLGKKGTSDKCKKILKKLPGISKKGASKGKSQASGGKTENP